MKYISRFIVLLILACSFNSMAQDVLLSSGKINSFELITAKPLLYSKTEFTINITAGFVNPYSAKEITLDLLLVSPSGKEITQPCFYISGDPLNSTWNARFAAREAGKYSYKFRLKTEKNVAVISEANSFIAAKTNKDGFLHTNGFWTLKFDSGKLFRGLGENVGWESRSHEDDKWNYDYLLPSLSKNGANFFRTWMCAWNLPLEWKKVHGTKRYVNSENYYNNGGIKRMDELVNLADSLGLYIMLTFDTWGTLHGEHWFDTPYNRDDPDYPVKFFTHTGIQQKYKDKIRYIVARWGYSTSIAAWEFFNEIDNGTFTKEDSILVPHDAVTDWHSEMSRYLNGIDPYDHIITTSISHRDIIGMNSLPFIDLNQKHIYKRTGEMRSEIFRYIQTYNKPYTIGEFGYEWDWNIDFSTITEGLEYDYKIGLWYGLFSPTPILPMSWWWEFFDERNMTPYFNSVKEINEQMLEAGKGSFEIVESNAGLLEAYGVRCGDKIFVYLLNNSSSDLKNDLTLKTGKLKIINAKAFSPSDRVYKNLNKPGTSNEGVIIPGVSLKSKEETVLILSAK